MTIKIISLNLWIGGIFFEEIISFCKKENADVYFFQEVYNSSDVALPAQYRSFTELQKQLNIPHAHFAPAFIETVEEVDTKMVQGNAILSRFPLTEISVTHYDVPFGERINSREAFHLSPRSLQHVTAAVENQTLHLLNTQGIWGEDGEDSPRRLQMAENIVAEIGESHPVILAGDLNVRPHTQTIATIEKKVINVFKDELRTTFNVKQKDLEKYPGYAEAVVDMLFITSDISVVEHWCLNVDISDHLPLVAILEI
jgi:endonuclease/exonuclease/phosphatase family metal-dependent hydrolase